MPRCFRNLSRRKEEKIVDFEGQETRSIAVSKIRKRKLKEIRVQVNSSKLTLRYNTVTMKTSKDKGLMCRKSKD
jgi:hypothetical protein